MLVCAKNSFFNFKIIERTNLQHIFRLSSINLFALKISLIIHWSPLQINRGPLSNPLSKFLNSSCKSFVVHRDPFNVSFSSLLTFIWYFLWYLKKVPRTAQTILLLLIIYPSKTHSHECVTNRFVFGATPHKPSPMTTKTWRWGQGLYDGPARF